MGNCIDIIQDTYQGALIVMKLMLSVDKQFLLFTFQ